MGGRERRRGAPRRRVSSEVQNGQISAAPGGVRAGPVMRVREKPDAAALKMLRLGSQTPAEAEQF